MDAQFSVYAVTGQHRLQEPAPLAGKAGSRPVGSAPIVKRYTLNVTVTYSIVKKSPENCCLSPFTIHYSFFTLHHQLSIHLIKIAVPFFRYTLPSASVPSAIHTTVCMGCGSPLYSPFHPAGSLLKSKISSPQRLKILK